MRFSAKEALSSKLFDVLGIRDKEIERSRGKVKI